MEENTGPAFMDLLRVSKLRRVPSSVESAAIVIFKGSVSFEREPLPSFPFFPGSCKVWNWFWGKALWFRKNSWCSDSRRPRAGCGKDRRADGKEENRLAGGEVRGRKKLWQPLGLDSLPFPWLRDTPLRGSTGDAFPERLGKAFNWG